MTLGYRIASVIVILLFAVACMGSYQGWGLDDEAKVKGRSVRQGSIRGRHFYGGGPGFGK